MSKIKNKIHIWFFALYSKIIELFIIIGQYFLMTSNKNFDDNDKKKDYSSLAYKNFDFDNDEKKDYTSLAYKNFDFDNDEKKDYSSLEFTKNLRNNTTYLKERLKKHGNEIIYVPDYFKNDYEIGFAAVSSYGMALEHLSDNLKDNKNIVLTAVNEDYRALKFASERLQNDIDFYINILKYNYHILHFLPYKIKDNEDVIKFALKLNSSSLIHASDRLRDNEEIVDYACNLNYKNLIFASERILKKNLKKNLEKINELVKNDYRLFTHLPDSLKTYELIYYYIKNVKNNYFPYYKIFIPYLLLKKFPGEEFMFSKLKIYFYEGNEIHFIDTNFDLNIIYN